MIRRIKNYGIADILKYMREFTDAGSRDENVRQLAVSITSGTLYPSISIYEWVKAHLTYIPDPVINGKEIEQFTSPARLAKDFYDGKPIGEDCDSHAMFVVALNQAVGIAARVVIVGVSSPEPDHAFAEVLTSELGWVATDTTSARPIGWIYPYYTRIVV
jgi:transglutaminase-like putative cysteine protease